MSEGVTAIAGGDLLARTLQQAGVAKVFALHGGHLEGFYKACLELGIELVDFRHESSAGHAAEAYSRVTGKLGVCAVTSGPGFTNAVTAIANANLDCVPTLFIVGAPPVREAETNALQGGIDQTGMAASVTKWSHRILTTERIPDLTAMAVRHATTGRRGAVLLEVPIDVLHMSVPADKATRPAGIDVTPKPGASPGELDEAIRILRTAERPAIVCGVEAGFARCGPALTAFVERAGIPVFFNARGMGLLPSDHRLNGHLPGNLVSVDGPRPDTLLLLGTRLGMRLGGRGYSLIPADAEIIQQFSDASEIGRIRDVTLPIACDSGTFVQQLADAAEGVEWPDHGEWCASLVGRQHEVAAQYPHCDMPGGVHPYHAAGAVIEAAGKDAILVIDGGEAASWAASHGRTSEPGGIIAPGNLGCLGTGPGQSIGAQEAAPGRRVLQITGDGASGFHIGEFDVMRRRSLPVMTVILNNEIWGMSLHGQQMMYGTNYSAIAALGGTQYASIAKSFGCYGERVTRFADIGPACQRAWDSGLPSCIEIMTDKDVTHPVTAAALGAPGEGEAVTLIPYYENIPS
jgi:Thiamine pyrophosphate-requiring enzymes [acetolactate synthase, pyruvate dehydrogenase (cytochrome), glyoxylate carboligase, phosphonopyruvate decarboxylase]